MICEMIAACQLLSVLSFPDIFSITTRANSIRNQGILIETTLSHAEWQSDRQRHRWDHEHMTNGVEVGCVKTHFTRGDKESTYLRWTRLCGDVNGGLFN